MNVQEFTDKVIEYASCNDIESKVAEVKNLTRFEFDLISYVYNFHPNIDPIKGKCQVAMLYCEFGMRIFEDMRLTAKCAKDLEEQLNELNNKLEKSRSQYNKLKNLRILEDIVDV